jgi:hypothetical protein
MSHTTTEAAADALKVAPGLETFVAAVRDSNPFAANRVNEPSRYDVDGPSIHGPASIG